MHPAHRDVDSRRSHDRPSKCPRWRPLISQTPFHSLADDEERLLLRETALAIEVVLEERNVRLFRVRLGVELVVRRRLGGGRLDLGSMSFVRVAINPSVLLPVGASATGLE